MQTTVFNCAAKSFYKKKQKLEMLVKKTAEETNQIMEYPQRLAGK